jgi:hypothetical protein
MSRSGFASIKDIAMDDCLDRIKESSSEIGSGRGATRSPSDPKMELSMMFSDNTTGDIRFRLLVRPHVF